MASYYKPPSFTSGVDTVELDRALHNLEFEKKQQIQELEKEKQQIGILEASLKEKQDGIQRMEENLCRIDEETKNCHRQFRQNKEQKESQKAHASVLNFHLDTKKKEFQLLTEKYEVENAGLQRKLEHYDTVWKSYEEIYMQQENAQELMKWQLEVLQRKEAVKEGSKQIAHLQKAEDAVQEEICANEPPFQSLTDFIIKIAEIKVSTQDKRKETEQIMDSISIADKEIQTMQDTQAEIIKKLEEKRKEEEQERQRIEKEKELKENAKQEELARKKKEEQQNAANSKASVYKFGQFLHRVPTPSQAPASRLPPTSKRNAPSKPPPLSARTPLLMPSPASHGRQPLRSSAPQGSGAAAGGGLLGSTQPPVSQPSSSRFFINVPPRSPALVDRGGRRPAPMPYMGSRGAKSQQLSQISQVVSSPSVALADTMYNMNIQTPTRPSHSKTLGQVAPATPHQPTLEVSSGPDMGPGGDAKPSTIVSRDQQPGPEDGQMSCMPHQLMETDPQEGLDMDSVQEYPLTPKSSTDMERVDSTETPQTPKEQFDLAGFKDFPKSPGFSYSCRAMFGDPGDTTEDQTSNNSNFQENPFFSSFFGVSSRFSDRPTSQSPAQMFGGGGNQPPSTPETPQTNQGGAMSMFGNSPTSPQSSQTRQEPESMGFSFNFGGESPSQTPAGGENESGGSRPGGFCLF